MSKSLFSNAVSYYRANGARNTVARSVFRLAGLIEKRVEEAEPPLDIGGFYTVEALPLPIKRIKNTSGTRRLSLVLPTVRQEHLYAGAWTALKIFWETAKANGYRPRIISATSPYSTEGLEKLDFIGPEEIAGIEHWHHVDDVPCEIEEDEIFIVTAWWTAYVIKELEHTNRIFYLVQDFEPGFYPWSYRYVLALESYKLSYSKIFNTAILEEFFREQKLLSGENLISFEPGIDKTLFYPGEKNRFRETGKATILLYGRPEVTRNLFELAILSLEHFFRTNPSYREKVGEIISVGEKHGAVMFDGIKIESRGKLSMNQWANLARESDIGISLMCSPHPSYPPLEMVASGMVVVTNRIYNKDLSEISNNFIAADMNIEDLAAAIRTAVDRLEDQESIRNNAELFLSQRDWDENLRVIPGFIAENQVLEKGQSKG